MQVKYLCRLLAFDTVMVLTVIKYGKKSKAGKQITEVQETLAQSLRVRVLETVLGPNPRLPTFWPWDLKRIALAFSTLDVSSVKLQQHNEPGGWDK